LSPPRSRVEIGRQGARYYDLLLNLLSLGRYSNFVRRVVQGMGIRPGQSILDLGSGTGRSACLLAEETGRSGRIVGLDISDEMLRRARNRCGAYPAVTFEKRRIEHSLPYEDEFDKVYISFVLHGFEDSDKLRIIGNSYRALKAGGEFYILDYGEFDIEEMWSPLRWAFTHWECQLAVEFLTLNLKEMLQGQGFTGLEETFFLKGYLRLMKAFKPFPSASREEGDVRV